MNDVEKLLEQVSDFKSYTGMLERKIAMIENAIVRLENDRKNEIKRLQDYNQNELTESTHNYIQGELHTYEMLKSEIAFLKSIVEF